MTSASHVLFGSDYFGPDFPLYATRERERFHLPVHAHDFIEIHYVAEGRGVHYIAEERLSVEKGDLFVVPIGTRHVYRPSSEAARDELIVYNCLFDPKLLSVLRSSYPFSAEIDDIVSGKGQAYRRYKDVHHEARMHMEALLREFRTKQPGFEAAMYALLTQLLVHLHRLERNVAAPPPAYAQFGTVLAYLADHVHLPVTLEDVARLVPASPGYVQRMFKRTTGQSFTEYVQNLRIEKSVELLTTTSLPVKEIAAKVGYRDMKFFHALFRKKTGRSPGRYRSERRPGAPSDQK